MTTLDETRHLLRTVGTVLDKTIPDDVVPVWAKLLESVPLTWAKAAAMDLLATSPFLPKPADVITRAKALAAEERQRQDRQRQQAIDAASREPERPVAVRGPDMLRALLAEIAARNKGVTDRAARRSTAETVAYEFRDRIGAAPDRPGLPCRDLQCRCTHTEGCDAGWIEMETDEGAVQAFPCPKCSGRRHGVLTSGSTREAAMRTLRDTSDVKASAGDAW